MCCRVDFVIDVRMKWILSERRPLNHTAVCFALLGLQPLCDPMSAKIAYPEPE